MITQLHHSLRILFKYRLYTGFAIVGFSIAIASAWFIADFVTKSYQYDTFHTNHQNIYRLTMEVSAGGNSDHFATTGKPLGELLHRNYPDIKAYAKVSAQHSVVSIDDELFKESDFFSTNPQIFEVFSFDFIRGSQATSLNKPNSIILSASLAKKYFNKLQVIGKSLIINEQTYTVTGIFQDWPENSHIHIQALLSSESSKQYEVQDWFNLENYTYVLLNNNTNPQKLNNHLDHLLQQQLSEALKETGIEVKFHAQALQDLYYSPGLIDDVAKGSKAYIQALTLAGIFIFLIAGLNFINLMLTISTQRSKEILLKKILGISPKQLIRQSGIESILLTLSILLLSTGFILSFERDYFEYTSFSSMNLWEHWLFILIIPIIVFIFGLLGSTYAGTYLSFSKTSIIKEAYKVKVLKNLLLASQYVIAAVILIITLVMERQLAFIKHKELGFSQEQVLIVDLPDDESNYKKNIQFKEQIQQFAPIQNTSLIGGGALPGDENGKEIFEVTLNGTKTEKVYNIYRVDENYFELLDIPFSSGRNFKVDISSDKSKSVIINQALANALNWKNPLGKKIWYGDEMREVIGVVNNFHNKSLHNIIEPIVFLFDTNYTNHLLVKTQATNSPYIESTWAKFYPQIPFSLRYFDQFINAMYQKENQLALLFRFFVIVSLMLCATGLFALFSLHVLQKTKEMSIRKVLGANYINLLKSITKHFRSIVLLSILIAIPFAWWFVKNWLNEFSYKVQIGIDVYLISGMVILLISVLTIAFHLLKILYVNPVDSLKHE